MNAFIRHCHGTLAEWTQHDPVLAKGEVVLVATDAAKPTEYNCRKVGDGQKKFSQLPLLGFDCLPSTGTSTLQPMSQKATTDAIAAGAQAIITQTLTDDTDKVPSAAAIKGTITPVITSDALTVPSNAAVAEAIYNLEDPLFLDSPIINSNDSKESLKKVIKDVWFTGLDSLLDNDSYYAKVGIFGRGQNTTDTFMVSIYLTNGLSASIPDLYQFSARDLTMKDNMGHCILKCTGLPSAECHVLLDTSELVANDYSPYAGYDLIFNEGVGKQSMVIKKRKTAKVLGNPLIPDGSIDYDKICPISFYDDEVTSESDKAVRGKEIFQLNRILGTSLISHDVLAEEDINNICIFSSSEESEKKPMGTSTMFVCREYTLNKNDLICVYGRCSDNGQAFMVSKKIGGNNYRCLCREKGHTADFYTAIADEDGTYAVCAYLNQSKKYHVYRFTSTVLSAIRDELGQKMDISENGKCVTDIRKLYLFKNALFCGDSVTKGFVVEGTADNPGIIYGDTNPDYSYPSRFHDMFPSIETTILARSGISATAWKTEFLPTAAFEDYDLIVFELGLNGYLNIDHIDTEGTNTNDYRKIVQKARQDNPAATIVLVASSHYTSHWVPILDVIAEECGCMVVDLKDKSILDLDNPCYHGYALSDGTPAMDYAHFTRKGYLAKAYVVARMIETHLTDDTEY